MNEKTIENQQDKKPESKPNESSGIYFSSSIKISDPNTKEVLVQMRGDN
jgi:hypothetical protein